MPINNPKTPKNKQNFYEHMSAPEIHKLIIGFIVLRQQLFRFGFVTFLELSTGNWRKLK